MVVAAKDTVNGKAVAIKKCFNIFQSLSDAKKIAREVRSVLLCTVVVLWCVVWWGGVGVWIHRLHKTQQPSSPTVLPTSYIYNPPQKGAAAAADGPPQHHQDHHRHPPAYGTIEQTAVSVGDWLAQPTGGSPFHPTINPLTNQPQ